MFWYNNQKEYLLYRAIKNENCLILEWPEPGRSVGEGFQEHSCQDEDNPAADATPHSENHKLKVILYSAADETMTQFDV